MSARHLSAVPESARTPRTYRTIAAAARANDRLGMLRAIRVRLAKAMDDPDTSPADLSALSRRMREISDELDLPRGPAPGLEEDDGDIEPHELDRRRFDPSTL